MRAIVAATVAALVLSGCRSHVRAPDRFVRLGAPAHVIAQTFTHVTSVAAAGPDRLVVLDSGAGVVDLVDFAKATVQQVGGRGSGAGEHSAPNWLIPVGTDTVLIADSGGGRYEVVARGVMTVGSVALGSEPLGADGVWVRAVDRQGRRYGTGARSEGSDSVALLRSESGSGRADTLTYLHVSGGSPSSSTAGSGSVDRYPMVDDWGVLPDGTVIVARIAHYRIDVIPPGKPMRRGRPLSFEVPRDSAGRTKPPFVADDPSRELVSPDARLWLRATTPDDQREERYRLIDHGPQFVREVVFPPGVRLVGLGSGVAYATRGTPGHETLEVYTIQP